MSAGQRNIVVFADWVGLGGPRRMGTLGFSQTRGKGLFSFEYDRTWLAEGVGFELDPYLRLFSGPQYPVHDMPNFGLFLDSCPDRWGRLLMRRREALDAREASRPLRPLTELDYLLGVYDLQRAGALRFKDEADGCFLNDDGRLATPPLSSLRELEQASLALEDERKPALKDEAKWLRQLLAPGSSLGGARPKAGVLGEDNSLWIAKFPSRTDTHDKGAWEYLVHTLASQCGLHVPVARLLKTGRKHHIFLSKRFDRVTGGGRLHFSSALNLAGLADGTGAVSGAGYFDILEIILRHSSSPVEDAREIWMRLIFGLCTGNTDDHLRNHGFLLDGANSKGWRLSPAFDINPDPDGDTLALNILPDDNRMDLDIALSVCDHFRLKLEDAKAQMTRIQSVVSTWRKVAKRLRLPRQEQEAMAHAFRLSEDSQ